MSDEQGNGAEHLRKQQKANKPHKKDHKPRKSTGAETNWWSTFVTVLCFPCAAGGGL